MHFLLCTYRTRTINGRGLYSKIIFWAIGCGLYSREASIQKLFLQVMYLLGSLKATEPDREIVCCLYSPWRSLGQLRVLFDKIMMNFKLIDARTLFL